MSQELVYVDTSEILEGKLEEARKLIRELVDFVQTNEAAPLAYHIYIDQTGTRMSVFQVHPDSTSLERHMEIGLPLFLRFSGAINLLRIDLYGEPSPSLRAQLAKKAEALGTGAVVVHRLEAGFSRWSTPRMS